MRFWVFIHKMRSQLAWGGQVRSFIDYSRGNYAISFQGEGESWGVFIYVAAMQTTFEDSFLPAKKKEKNIISDDVRRRKWDINMRNISMTHSEQEWESESGEITLKNTPSCISKEERRPPYVTRESEYVICLSVIMKLVTQYSITTCVHTKQITLVTRNTIRTEKHATKMRLVSLLDLHRVKGCCLRERVPGKLASVELKC